MSNIQVEILLEAGYEQALMGMASSYKDTSLSRKEWWTWDQQVKATKRATKLAHKGGGHNKFLEHIEVWMWVRAPRGWWQEADTYRLASKQSESTMHTITKRELTQDDFATTIPFYFLDHLNKLIQHKEWIELKHMLPEGFMQAREWKMNYKTLKNIIEQRATHRLPEWPSFVSQVMGEIAHPKLLVPADRLKELMPAVSEE
jgi:thymidylate synthase ThyX